MRCRQKKLKVLNSALPGWGDQRKTLSLENSPVSVHFKHGLQNTCGVGRMAPSQGLLAVVILDCGLHGGDSWSRSLRSLLPFGLQGEERSSLHTDNEGQASALILLQTKEEEA